MKFKPFTSLALLAAVSIVTSVSPVMAASTVPMTPSAKVVLQAPLQPSGTFFASTDPNKQNVDYLVLKAGETRRIPLSAGILKRLWVTALEPDKIDLFLQNGAKSPLLLAGKAAEGEFYQKAFTFYPEAKTPAPLVRLNKDAALIVTNNFKGENKFFYQSYVVPNETNGPGYASFDSKTIALSRQVKIQGGDNSAPLDIAAGGKSGVVSELRIKLTPATLDTWSKVFLRIDRLKITSRKGERLRATSEGNSRIVFAPLSALAGQFYALKPVDNAMTSFDGKTLTLRWPMPFDATKDNMQVNLENRGSQPVDSRLDLTIRTTSAPSPYLFCALSGSGLSQKGKPLNILKATGEGVLTGLNFAVAPTASSPKRAFAYLEGNESIIADGRTFEGTGTEDFFNSAWYFPKEGFSRPFHGMTFKSELPPRVSAYRLLIRDALPFKKELNFLQEVGRNNNSDDLEYRWVAFWYQKAPVNYDIADSLQVAAAPPAGSGGEQPAGSGSSALIWIAFIVAAIVGFGWTLTRKKRA